MMGKNKHYVEIESWMNVKEIKKKKILWKICRDLQRRKIIEKNCFASMTLKEK